MRRIYIFYVTQGLGVIHGRFHSIIASQFGEFRALHFCLVPTRFTNVMAGMTYTLEIKSVLLV